MWTKFHCSPKINEVTLKLKRFFKDGFFSSLGRFWGIDGSGLIAKS
jgi:hypothetical protein